MLPLLVVVLSFVATAGVVYFLGAAASNPGSVPSARIAQVLEAISEGLPLSPSDVSVMRRWLIQAGYRDAIDVNYYLGARIVGAALGCLLVLLFQGLKNFPLLVGIAGLGFFLPRFVLKRMIKRRQQRIRLGLPGVLDLMVICVEAGLTLDQALMRVGQDLHHAYPDLSDELQLVNLEMRAGKPRAEALRNLLDRTGVDEIRGLVRILVVLV